MLALGIPTAGPAVPVAPRALPEARALRAHRPRSASPLPGPAAARLAGPPPALALPIICALLVHRPHSPTSSPWPFICMPTPCESIQRRAPPLGTAFSLGVWCQVQLNLGQILCVNAA
ncbi:hypothetical protein AURDEDRAFT_171148 [Auricularia subglabra TFB-10046 SS5]|uniref:Uncharacterized protein n=1 Tax=Auricularia subglabra (strain TFB-10046 / SS5) TaxID=717982 RepID=J0DC82_AURST|nr:hypothetical protein AURDEDRAFT_171148 [Auricularia subglabra TFB-10046 SS5]